MIKQAGIVLASFMLVVTSAGCGSSGEVKQQGAAKAGTEAVSEKSDPVTIKLGMWAAGYLTEDEFNRYIVEPNKKKYPHITIEKQVLDDKANSLPNLLATNNMPDIIIQPGLYLPDVAMYKVDADLTELIKKHKMDLGKFEQSALDAVKIMSGRNYLVGLPYTAHINALYYNKDIFDKFGVPYPKDGMTWKDAIELAKKVTRNDRGVQYRGLEPDSMYRAGSQLELPLIDPKTEKSIGSSDGWKEVAQMVKSIYEIEGNGNIQMFSAGVNAFLKDQNLAMLAGLNWIPRLGEVANTFSNWDMVSYPVWPQAPGKGTQYDAHILLVTSTSKNKDDAFKVISTVVSDEVQLDMSRNAKFSMLKDKKFKDEFGKDLAFLQGKNVAAVFKTTPAKPVFPTRYGTKAFNDFSRVMDPMIKKKVDINTALREYDESMDKYIQENKAK